MTTTAQGWTPLAPLPDPLAALLDVAQNFHWTYSPAAWSAFERLDPALWESTQHNPVRTIAGLSAERAAAASRDTEITRLAAQALRDLQVHLDDKGWYAAARVSAPAGAPPFLAAYFCAEFGIAECFQIYSGGLGLLAGDHLKSASDLGLPLIAVGLLYRNGYFHQALDEHGLQRELFPALDPGTQPVKRILGADGKQVQVHVDLPGRRCSCAVWRADVGKVRLYLLDTNIDENSADDREITANLYLGDQRRRIEQEIVLGIGGVRALEAVGERPTVFHMNEGHAAFMALERIRLIRARSPNLTFDQAREAAAPAHLFTTHTPVPAGIDHFHPGLVQSYFEHYHPALGLDMEGLMALGRENVADRAEPFSMAVLAIRSSKWCNGVSRLHGRVSRTMWKNIWPGVPEGEVPIGHVTNGVHTAGWVSSIMAAVYDKHLPKAWRTSPDDPGAWSAVEKVPPAELWRARQASRTALINYCQRRAAAGGTGGTPCALSPDLLTIGFARRFAGYKRATLLFRDAERLRKILCGEAGGSGGSGPGFQLVVAGKSHPGDGWGKHLIRDLVEYARDPKFKGRILFIEDYGIDVARELVRGCDVWLNTPIRGLEASGTSGMKAAANGVLNASILDGWWDEGYSPDAGYKIDDSGIYPSDAPDDHREDVEAEALYRLLETAILPDFSTRDAWGTPLRWVAKMKACIAQMAPLFSTHRMVKEYAQKYYFPAHAFATRLGASDVAAGVGSGGGGGGGEGGGGDLRQARELADHIDRYRRAWPGVRVKTVDCAPDPSGSGFNVAAAVRLAGLRPEEVAVEVYHGTVDKQGLISEGTLSAMTMRAALADTTFHFAGVFSPAKGLTDLDRCGVSIRVVPADDRLVNPYIPGLIVCSTPVGIASDHGLNL